MAAANSDLFRKGGANTVTTLAAPGKALAATSITVGSTTNYPTDTGIVIGIRQVDSDGVLVPGTYSEYNATVTSGTTFSIDAVPVLGSDQVYPAGSTTQVFLPVSSSAHNDLIDGLVESHAQDGTIDAQSVANFRDHIDMTDGKAIRDGNDNEVIKISQTTSAVNELTVKNAATGNAVQLQATGGDTNIDINHVSKGTGKVRANGNRVSTYLAYAEKTSNQNFTTEAVITDLTLTFTVPASGGLVRIEVHGYASNTASATQTIRLRENNISGTVVQSRPSFVAAITATESVSFSWCKELTAGTYTYVVTGAAASGTATWQGGATAPSYALATLF